MAVIDAWGKLPSGLLDGNFYDFGTFSECFHIQRNMELYPTKYCTGQVIFDLNGISSAKSQQYRAINRMLPNVWQLSDNQVVPKLAPIFAQQ